MIREIRGKHSEDSTCDAEQLLQDSLLDQVICAEK